VCCVRENVVKAICELQWSDSQPTVAGERDADGAKVVHECMLVGRLHARRLSFIKALHARALRLDGPRDQQTHGTSPKSHRVHY